MLLEIIDVKFIIQTLHVYTEITKCSGMKIGSHGKVIEILWPEYV